MAKHFLFPLTFLLISWSSIHASLDPPLDSLLATSSPDTSLSVIVVMKERVDLGRMKRSYDRAGTNFRDRHLQTILALKEKATGSQRDFIAFLNDSMKGGGIHDFRSFWIDNAVFVTASPSVILDCSKRDDVDTIFLNDVITLPLPVTKSVAPMSSQGFEPNLGIIGADALWQMGHTGKDVLVCTFDSGVDVNHPALSSKWRGGKGFPLSECWFDPYNHTNTPVDDNVAGSTTHGTGVMSIILGSEGADTVGVAPGAMWIAANAFESDNSGTQVTTTGVLLECFEWAADPDGDPMTIEDVPRVINNSWGTNLTYGRGSCESSLYGAIDAVEVMGAAVFFSQGNTGPGPFTTASPASRIASPVNAFAVGAVTESLDIASFSSRGPSTCDSSTVKPEVVAPGNEIRMARGTVVGGGYHSMSGTSFSTPHASGAAALLLGVNPSLTGDQVKYAILNSARDLGDSGEDNSFGTGLIDLPAALSLIGSPSEPFISVVDIAYRDNSNNAPDPGETVNLVLTLSNSGTSVNSLQALLTTEHPYVYITQPTASYGDLAGGEEASNTGSPFTIDFGNDVTDGERVPFFLVITWSGGGSDTLAFTSVIGTVPAGSYGNHDIGNVTFTITNFGQYGYYNGASAIGEGFRFPGSGTNWLFHGAFLAAASSSRVSDGTDGGESDWRVLPGGNLTFTTAGEVADQEGYAAFHDGGADSPMDLHILQRSFAYSDNVNNDYVILVYFVINSNPADSLTNLYTGLYFDWDLDGSSFDRNYVDWLPENSLGYMWGESFDEYVGVSLLSHTPTSYRAIDNPAYVYNGFSETSKYNFLTGGFNVTRGGTLNDWSQMLSVGPFTIEPLDTMSVVFAVLGGGNFADLRTNAISAQAKYEEIKDLLPLTVVPPTPPSIIGELSLSQNFPNPFLPSENGHTTISYRVSATPDSATQIPVTLKVYDLRGRLVKVLVNDNLPPDDYFVQWNGRDDREASLPSGIYLYRLKQGAIEVTRKLVLIH